MIINQTMRISLIFLLCLVGNISVSISQTDMNQFDANGKRHGPWSKNYKDSDQIRYEGTFVHGKESGVFNFFCSDCGDTPSMKKLFIINSEIAEVSYFSKNGKIISTGQMNHKLREGEWTYYHSGTKNILTKEHYTNGVLDGKKVTYYRNNVLAEEITYKNGVKSGVNNYFSTKGKPLKELIFVNDKLHGPAIYYNGYGIKILEGNYKNGRKYGIWKKFKNNDLIAEEVFPKK